MKELKVLQFINENDNWKEILSASPYCLKIKQDGEYTLLKYDQVFSDLNLEIVRECRGLILDKNLDVVCLPFFKFGNYGESYASEIDWESARVQEKLDGAIIKLWFHNGKWNVSTNGGIDAYKSGINRTFENLNCEFENYGELFEVAKKNSGLDFDKLNKDYTYMFELVSPYVKIVVSYDETKLYHIGTRNIKTFEELNTDIGVEKPKEFQLCSLSECIEASNLLPFDQEGYVVVDKYFNRIKIKSPKYVYAHKIKNNGIINNASLVQMIRENETEEFLNYFPTFKPFIDEINKKIAIIFDEIENESKQILSKTYENQKEFALEVQKYKYKSYHFANRKKGISIFDWFWSHDNAKLVDYFQL
ncbi:MAG: hypothetical protein IJZ29_01310 [Clostridia bacterium]|nr:hypothetical protein [Clostridia bacterium]